MKNTFTKFSICSFALLMNVSAFADKTLKSSEKSGPAKNTGICFTENKGQVHDQNNKPRPDVLFGGTDGNLVFHLRNNGISYQLNRIDSWKKEEAPANMPAKNSGAEVPDKSTVYRLDINWLNSNSNTTVVKGKPLPGFDNYYYSNCPNGALNVQSFKEVFYKNIYSGIDLKWYEKDGALEYDYLVAAGADYKAIQLEIKGAEKISINENGEITFSTPLGNIVEQAPLVIQNGRTLKAKWVITTNSLLNTSILSFNIDGLDQKQPFVIDPLVRVWGTYYGGAGIYWECGLSCTTDMDGNVYQAGQTSSGTGTIIATVGSHQATYGGPGSQDAYIVKFNAAGVRQWGTYYGGTKNDEGRCVVTDPTGNVYLAGISSSTDAGVIATVGSHQITFGGGPFDGFLAKFNSSGVRQWGTYYGGSGNDYAQGCAIDVGRNVFIVGFTESNAGTEIATVGSHQASLGGVSDAYLAKFDGDGVRQWATYYGGSNPDDGRSCSTDGAGNVFMSGHTKSNTGTVIATPGSHQPGFNSGTTSENDAYLVKFNSAGVRQWGTYYGDNDDDFGWCCATDASGNVYMAGTTEANTLNAIATAGSHQSTFGGVLDAYLVKFNTAGVRQWGTYYGGAVIESGYGCATDAGHVYLTGNSDATGTIIATVGSHQPVNAGGNDCFLVQFDQTGVRQWATFYGGTTDDDARSCTADANGNVYLSGQTQCTVSNVIATAGCHQPTYGGASYDPFIVQFHYDIQTGLHEANSSEAFSIYPNPGNGVYTLAYTGNKALLADVYNVYGALITSKKLWDNETQIDISAFSPGIYFIRVQLNDGTHKSVKVIKE